MLKVRDLESKILYAVKVWTVHNVTVLPSDLSYDIGWMDHLDI